ncbi:pseudouridine synthase [Streptomyces sp. 4N509B]|uniref:pseudouridine synthase n=1 Tax=Streptomyces sp. 4N509B TaxID=3457413 RepID=UPI003FCF9358
MRSSGRNSNRNHRGAGEGRDTRRQQRTGRPRPEERRYGSAAGGGGTGSAGRRGGGQGGQQGAGGRGGQQSQGGAQAGGRQSTGRQATGRPSGGASGRPTSGATGRAAGRPVGKATGKPAGRSAAPGARKGPERAGGRRGQAAPPARSRELQAQMEDRVRSGYERERPAPRLPKTFGEPEGERLQKVLARAGLGSRRACEELIDAARVEVNGRIVTTQGKRVDPERDEIKVDGLTIAAQKYLFFALNKPVGVVSAMEDPEGRPCLGDYVTNRETRLFHVGRLDTETEGLLLLTNHGELAHRLTHPRYGITKTYLAAIQGPVPRDLGKRLKEGVRLEDGLVRADHFRVVQNTGRNYLVEVSLHEGRKHIVRRMLAEVGFPVDRLVRTHFGPIALGDQKSGWLRRMTTTEVGQLMRAVGL